MEDIDEHNNSLIRTMMNLLSLLSTADGVLVWKRWNYRICESNYKSGLLSFIIITKQTLSFWPTFWVDSSLPIVSLPPSLELENVPIFLYSHYLFAHSDSFRSKILSSFLCLFLSGAFNHLRLVTLEMNDGTRAPFFSRIDRLAELEIIFAKIELARRKNEQRSEKLQISKDFLSVLHPCRRWKLFC